MDKPWKVIMAFVGVFIAGAVFGGLFTLRFERPAPVPIAPVVVREPAPTPTPAPVTPAQPISSPAVAQATPPQQRQIAPALMRQFTQRLSPTPDQVRKIRPLVTRAADDLQRMQREHLQDTTRVTERMYEDVSALLSPEQRLQLETMRQEMLERSRKAREKQGEAQGKAGAVNPNRKSGQIEGSNPPATPPAKE